MFSYSILNVIISLVLFLGISSSSASSSTKRPTLAFASELPSSYLTKYFSNENLNYIKSLNATIVVGTVDLSKERAIAVKKLNTFKIPTIIWVLLPKDEGYWMTLDNVYNATKRYAEIKQWIEQNELEIDGIGFDLEVDYRNLQEIKKDKWILLLESVISRWRVDELENAKNMLKALAHKVKEDFKLVDFVLPFIYDERRMNSTILQRITGVVDIGRDTVDNEIPMLYSSAFPYGPGILQSYGNQSNTLGVGVTGGIGSVGGKFYKNFTQFAWDLFLSRDLLNIYQPDKEHMIGVYSFEGCIDHGYLQKLTTLDWNTPLPPEAKKIYMEESVIINEQRESLQGLLYLSVQPFDAVKWAEAHPIEVFDHFIEALEAYYDWEHHVYPPQTTHVH